MTILIELNELTAKSVADAFTNRFIPYFGIPLKTLNDRDSHLTSHFWTTLVKLMDFEMVFTTAHH